MNGNISKTATLAALLLIGAPGASRPAQAQSAKALIQPWPARSIPHGRSRFRNRPGEKRGPACNFRRCEGPGLEKDGYHSAIEGKNGFTCIVERGWMSPSTARISGIRNCAAQSATTRRPCAPSSLHHSQDKADIEQAHQGPDGREDSDRACRQLAPMPEPGHVVHDVEKPISRR